MDGETDDVRGKAEGHVVLVQAEGIASTHRLTRIVRRKMMPDFSLPEARKINSTRTQKALNMHGDIEHPGKGTDDGLQEIHGNTLFLGLCVDFVLCPSGLLDEGIP